MKIYTFQLEFTLPGIVLSKKNTNRPVGRGTAIRVGGKLYWCQFGLVKDGKVRKWEAVMQAKLADMNIALVEEYPVQVDMTFFTEDKRRDVDNQGTTLIDLLVAAKILKNDTPRYVTDALSHWGGLDKANPHTAIKITGPESPRTRLASTESDATKGKV